MNRWVRLAVLIGVLAVHVIVIFTVSITTRAQQEREDVSVFKMVDVEEFEPPPQPEEPEREPPPDTAPPMTEGPAEIVLEMEDEVIPSPPAVQPEREYVPQHRISKPPEIPTETIRDRVDYPVLANRQGIEGVVYLELFIDETGVIRRIEILKEPGFGLGEAAAAAFDGVRVEPAEANGVPTAVRFRYPVRFQLR